MVLLNTRYLPSTDDGIDDRVVSSEPVPFAEWQFINLADRYDMRHVVIRYGSLHSQVVCRSRSLSEELGSVAAIIKHLAPGVRDEKVQPVGHTAAERSLQRIVATCAEICPLIRAHPGTTSTVILR